MKIIIKKKEAPNAEWKNKNYRKWADQSNYCVTHFGTQY